MSVICLWDETFISNKNEMIDVIYYFITQNQKSHLVISPITWMCIRNIQYNKKKFSLKKSNTKRDTICNMYAKFYLQGNRENSNSHKLYFTYNWLKMVVALRDWNRMKTVIHSCFAYLFTIVFYRRSVTFLMQWLTMRKYQRQWTLRWFWHKPYAKFS